METARGTAGDRPWAELFAELAFAPEPCELIVETGAQAHKVAFDREAVVWASSPVAADSPLRVALTYRVITTAMMPAVASQVAATPSADPIDVLAAVAQLPPETMLLLRRRMIAVAATRVFGLTVGTYRVTRGLTVEITDGAAIDVRALVYEGLRTHGVVEQLAGAIAPFGASFVLRPEVDEDVPQFGFSAPALLVVDELRAGASLDSLVHGHPDLGERGVLAIVNALLAVHALAPLEEPLSSRAPVPARSASRDLAARTNMTYELRADTDPGADIALDLAEAPASEDGAHAANPARDIEWFESPQSEGVESTATQPPLDLEGDDLVMAEREDERRATARPARTTDLELARRPGRDQLATLELAGERPARTTGRQAALDLADEHAALDLADEPPARTTGSHAALGGGRAKFPTQSPTTGQLQARPTLPDPPKRASGQHPALELPKRTSTPPPFADAPATTPRPHPALDPAPFDSQPRGRPTQHPALDLDSLDAPPRARPTQHPALDLDAPPRTRPTQHPALDLSSLDAPRARPTQHPALDPRTPQRSTTPPPGAAMSSRATPHPALEPPRRPTPQPDPRAPVRPTPVPMRPTPQPASRAATRSTPPATVAASPTEDAAAHYTRGVALMKVDMEKAVLELRAAARMSGDLDHIAVLAWAQFCLAPNKELAAKATKAALAKAIYQSQKPEIAHYYLGRMERMLGRDREALEQFQTVVSLVPRHTEALAEIRVLEARLNPKKR